MLTRVLNLSVSLIIAIAPQSLKRLLLRQLYGWEVAPSARIGMMSVFLNVRNAKLGPDASIGGFNLFRNLRYLELGDSARIGQWNWITSAWGTWGASGFDESTESGGRFIMGQHSLITKRHYIDCLGDFVLGSFSGLGGVRTTVITHQLDTRTNKVVFRSVEIGEHTYVGSDVRLAPGARIADRCMIAMGAVVLGKLRKPGYMYAGNPAKPFREAPMSSEFLGRTHSQFTMTGPAR